MISENASSTANANPSLATIPMSAYGYKETSSRPKSRSALPPRPDIAAGID